MYKCQNPSILIALFDLSSTAVKQKSGLRNLEL